jgi:hypothetical protein
MKTIFLVYVLSSVTEELDTLEATRYVVNVAAPTADLD